MIDPVVHALALAQKPHTGPIDHASGGRADHVPLDVPAESFVIPADVVSGLGEGNTANGMMILTRMFGKEESKPKSGVPIMAAGGEFVIGPQAVAKVGGGDMKRGHSVLSAFVKHARAETVKTMRKLKGPHR